MIAFISFLNFFLSASSNSLIFAHCFPINTPTFEEKIIISPSFAVFLITTLEIHALGKKSSTNFLIFTSSTKKSAPAL
jgi:hypothetical protein